MDSDWSLGGEDTGDIIGVEAGDICVGVRAGDISVGVKEGDGPAPGDTEEIVGDGTGSDDAPLSSPESLKVV